MLKGRSAIVTGSTSGIGLGIAQALAQAGAHVVLNGFGDAAQIEAQRAELAATNGVKVLYSPADMSKPEAIREMVAMTARELGGVDILVNNAGVQHVAPIQEFPEERWDLILAINLSAVIHATKAAIPLMRARKFGRIVNIASAHGLIASAFKSAYIAAKHGVVGFTKVTALEVAQEGITCNAICPGYVRTPLIEKQIDDQSKVHGIPAERVVKEIMLKEQPTLRFVETREIAALAVFLCGEGAASITGTALPIDGGWTAH